MLTGITADKSNASIVSAKFGDAGEQSKENGGYQNTITIGVETGHFKWYSVVTSAGIVKFDLNDIGSVLACMDMFSAEDTAEGGEEAGAADTVAETTADTAVPSEEQLAGILVDRGGASGQK